jgi:alpha-1,3-rhamnosyl/mannosyltransferase
VTLRVGLDVSPLAQTRAGTARYIRGLVAGLSEVDGIAVRPLAFGGRARATAGLRDVAWYPAALPLLAARERLDVLHCPTFRGPLRSRVPLVVTVHDLAVLRRPEAFNRWTRSYSRLAVPRVVRAARRVIAVSEFTRRELVELLGVPEDRVRVIPEAPEPVFRAEGPAAEGDYVLAVATLEPRKNLERAAEAARRAGLELRLAGEAGWGRVRVDGSGVLRLGYVSDEDLARLYRGARCLLYPSLYEGFGLPVLEAMACGTPVVTSVGGATEEVAGGAAVLVDPRDPQAIAAGIEEALGRRDELARLGTARVRAFDPRAAAERTAAVYREAAE